MDGTNFQDIKNNDRVSATMQALLVQCEFQGVSELLSAGGTLRNLEKALVGIVYDRENGLSPLETRLLENELAAIRGVQGAGPFTEKQMVDHIRANGFAEYEAPVVAPVLECRAA